MTDLLEIIQNKWINRILTKDKIFIVTTKQITNPTPFNSKIH